jgi:hypothetical protein
MLLLGENNILMTPLTTVTFRRTVVASDQSRADAGVRAAAVGRGVRSATAGRADA